MIEIYKEDGKYKINPHYEISFHYTDGRICEQIVDKNVIMDELVEKLLIIIKKLLIIGDLAINEKNLEILVNDGLITKYDMIFLSTYFLYNSSRSRPFFSELYFRGSSILEYYRIYYIDKDNSRYDVRIK